MKLKIGLSSFSRRWAFMAGLTAETFLEECRSIGAEVVQLCENAGLGQAGTARLEDLRRRAGDLGLDLEYGVSGVAGGALDRAARSAARLGAGVLRAVVDSDGKDPEEAVAEIRKILPLLEQEEIVLCLENHFRFPPPTIRRIVEESGSSRVSVCLDPLNSLALLVGPGETIRELAPRALSVHVKDAVMEREGTGFRLRGVPVGQGMLDIPALWKSVRGHVRSMLLESWMDREQDEERSLESEKEWILHGMGYLKNLQREMQNE